MKLCLLARLAVPASLWVYIVGGIALQACQACDPTVSTVHVKASPDVPDAGPAADDCRRACAVIAAAYDSGTCVVAEPSVCEPACERDVAQGTAGLLDVACVLRTGASSTGLQACRVGCP